MATTSYWTAKELEAYLNTQCPACGCHNLQKTGRLKEARCPICTTVFTLMDAIKYKYLNEFIPAHSGWSTEE
jgi:hypothetical protein